MSFEKLENANASTLRTQRIHPVEEAQIDQEAVGCSGMKEKLRERSCSKRE